MAGYAKKISRTSKHLRPQRVNKGLLEQIYEFVLENYSYLTRYKILASGQTAICSLLAPNVQFMKSEVA